MLMGIKLKAHPTQTQKKTLSQWMGSARFIWNAKCGDDKYLSTFARKYMPTGTYAPIDQKYSQYKSDTLSPWLSDCPSQILRNSAVNWFQTYQKFLKGECGKPKSKKKSRGGSIHLTNELFEFRTCDDGVVRLFIGSKTNHIGFLALKYHGYFNPPKSLHVKKKNGVYWVSFCYEDDLDDSLHKSQQDHLKFLQTSGEEFLQNHTIGIDRGVVRPIQAGAEVFDLSPEQKRKKLLKETRLKRHQRRLARQKKGSKRREKTKRKLAKSHEKIANIRKDFCHQASHKIVANPETKVIILEDLKTKNMTAKPKAKPSSEGKWEKNGSRAKAGLNRSILDKGWHQFESFLKYKAYRTQKAYFKVSAYQTSQECAACNHTHWHDILKEFSRAGCNGNT
jgi:putative transposase